MDTPTSSLKKQRLQNRQLNLDEIKSRAEIFPEKTKKKQAVFREGRNGSNSVYMSAGRFLQNSTRIAKSDTVDDKGRSRYLCTKEIYPMDCGGVTVSHEFWIHYYLRSLGAKVIIPKKFTAFREQVMRQFMEKYDLPYELPNNLTGLSLDSTQPRSKRARVEMAHEEVKEWIPIDAQAESDPDVEDDSVSPGVGDKSPGARTARSELSSVGAHMSDEPLEYEDLLDIEKFIDGNHKADTHRSRAVSELTIERVRDHEEIERKKRRSLPGSNNPILLELQRLQQMIMKNQTTIPTLIDTSSYDLRPEEFSKCLTKVARHYGVPESFLSKEEKDTMETLDDLRKQIKPKRIYGAEYSFHNIDPKWVEQFPTFGSAAEWKLDIIGASQGFGASHREGPWGMIRRKPSSIGASQRFGASHRVSAQAKDYRRKPRIRRKPSGRPMGA
jgi:hypothetical protein